VRAADPEHIIGEVEYLCFVLEDLSQCFALLNQAMPIWLSKNRVRGQSGQSPICAWFSGVRGVCDSGTEPELFVVEIEYLCVTSKDLLRRLNYGPNP
jgi:hypothetical protein